MKFTITAVSAGKTFSKTVEAESEKRALEQLYSLAGAEHGFLRRKISVLKIKAEGK